MIFSNIKIIDLISLLVILLSVLTSLVDLLGVTVIIWIIAYFLSNILFLSIKIYEKFCPN